MHGFRYCRYEAEFSCVHWSSKSSKSCCYDEPFWLEDVTDMCVRYVVCAVGTTIFCEIMIPNLCRLSRYEEMSDESKIIQKPSRAGCCPCPPTSTSTFIHGDSFGGAMIDVWICLEDSLIKTLETCNKNFQILKCFFLWFWCLASKQTHWFHKKEKQLKKKALPGFQHFFFQRNIEILFKKVDLINA